MFDIGASELLVIVVVAVLVIGPRDLPLAMRAAGRWIGKMRKISGHFRAGIDAMVRDAEMEEMERAWRAQNQKIMQEHPHATPVEMEPTGAYPPRPPAASGPASGPASGSAASGPGSDPASPPAGAEAAARAPATGPGASASGGGF